LPATGRVRCFGYRLASFERRLREAGYVSFGSIPGAFANTHKEVLDRVSRCPELFGDALHRGTVSIETEALFFREAFGVMRRTIISKRDNTPSAKRLGEIVGMTQEQCGDLSKEHSLLQHPSCIIQKGVCKFDGHVFDLETEVGWYATGLLNSNCRCVAYPIPPETPTDDEDEP
jgi:hypothetical protein